MYEQKMSIKRNRVPASENTVNTKAKIVLGTVGVILVFSAMLALSVIASAMIN